jgi:small subunit ribosomal protein S4
MARYRGPTNRLARREGVDLGLKTSGSNTHVKLMRRIKVKPGMHGQKGGRRKVSDYGLQLREKQKVKRIYGLLERQFHSYYVRALRHLGNTGEALLVTLERRLDNALYRLNLSPTRAFARQMVTHGHVTVDGKNVNIPSFRVKPGMVIAIKDKMLNNPVVKKMLEEKEPKLPDWLVRKGPVGKVSRMPKREDILEDISEQLIIEFYSR